MLTFTISRHYSITIYHTTLTKKILNLYIYIYYNQIRKTIKNLFWYKVVRNK